MTLVRLCMEMDTGRFRHLPQAGAAIDQNPLLISCMRICWYTWYINEYKPAHQIPVTAEDSDFMNDLLPKDYQPKSYYSKNAVKEVIGKL